MTKKPDSIVILGWGSLIWRPENLCTSGEWISAGPLLPIEFSRVSENGRLTLVIDETNGVNLPTRYIRSGHTQLSDAIENLRIREGAKNSNGIGYIDLNNNTESARSRRDHPVSTRRIFAWAKAQGFSSVIWTAIGPRFIGNGEFSVPKALEYLKSLDGTTRAEAFEYIRNAPVEIQTPVRESFNAEFG